MVVRPQKEWSHIKMRLIQGGYSIIELVVGLSVSMLVVFGASKLIIDSKKVSSQSDLQMWLSLRAFEFQNVVKSEAGWAALVTANPDMSCFSSAGGCALFPGQRNLILPLNGELLDSAAGNLGLRMNGDVCRNYTSDPETDACPVQLKFYWQAICDGASCLQPQPKISIRFASKKYTVSSYNLEVYRDPRIETMNDLCNSLGGVLAGTVCTLPQLNTLCDPGAGSFPLGFNAVGVIQCGRPDPGSCAANDVGIGFNAAGGIQCAPACL